MKRTIARRIYLTAFLPLAVLAIVLVIANGYSRIHDANRQLQDVRQVMVELLDGPAREALVIGNVLYFEQLAVDLQSNSSIIRCVSLRDIKRVVISQTGRCQKTWSANDVIAITTQAQDLSDFPDEDKDNVIVGELLLTMRQDQFTQKIRQILLQLFLTSLMVTLVFYIVGRLLQTRLVRPIRQIDAAMRAVSQKHYDARIAIAGDDELARLSASINATIDTIEEYTRELTERRDDAERALHAADEAYMARDALVRSMTEDLQGPIGMLHSEITAVAIANTDQKLRQRIKSAMGLVQEAEENCADLIEIATSGQQPKNGQRYRDLGDIMVDMERDIRLLAQTDNIAVHFVVSQSPLDSARTGAPTSIFVCIDSIRLKKVLIHIIRAVGKRCSTAGVYVTAELIKIDAARLNVSISLKAFYAPRQPAHTTAGFEGPLVYSHAPPDILQWTDRETKIVTYLLRALDITPTFTASPTGAVTILLDSACQFSVRDETNTVSTEWLLAPQPVVATIVTNDESLMRLSTRSELSGHDISIISFARALADTGLLMAQDALLVDISDDISLAVNLVEQLHESNNEKRRAELIAVCPPGHLSDALGNRLFELGFKGLIQKPFYLVRLVEVLRTTLVNPLQSIESNSRNAGISDDRSI